MVVTMGNSPEVGIAYQALWRAGAVRDARELPARRPRISGTSSPTRRPSAVITTPEFADKVREATEGLGHVRHLISTAEDRRLPDPRRRFATAEPAEIVPRGDDELAALLYTGGTTGRSKGVMLTHANLAYTGEAAHRSVARPGTQPRDPQPAAVARVRPAGDDRRPVQPRAGRRRAAAVVRPQAVPRDDRRAPHPARGGGADDAPGAPLPAARGLRPQLAAVRHLRRRAARAGRGRAVRQARSVGHDSAGIRPDRDRGADLEHPRRPREAGRRRPSGPRHRGADPRRRRRRAGRPARWGRSARARPG